MEEETAFSLNLLTVSILRSLLQTQTLCASFFLIY